MNRKLFTAIAICTCLFLTACSSGKSETEAEKSATAGLTTLERKIEEANTFDELIKCSWAENLKDEDLKEKFYEKVKDYLFSDGKLNGIYYYTEQFLSGATSSDIRCIYAVSKDEIYITPISCFTSKNYSDISSTISAMFEKNLDAQAMLESLGVENLDVNCIADMNDTKSYRYSVMYVGIGSENEHGKDYIYAELARVSDSDTITLYYDDSEYITFCGYFPNQIKDGSYNYATYMDYYLDPQVAQSVSAEKYAQDVQEKEEAEEERKKLKKSTPKVGMTASEVCQSAWGEPDDINKDTYSWGTKEQWVYKKKGYVYLTDGVVTSVSEV